MFSIPCPPHFLNNGSLGKVHLMRSLKRNLEALKGLAFLEVYNLKNQIKIESF